MIAVSPADLVLVDANAAKAVLGLAKSRAERGETAIAAVPLRVPTGLDLLRVFEAADAGSHRVYWHQRSRNSAMVGLGCAAAVDATGADRFATAAERSSQLFRTVVADQASRGLLRCLGGFAFDDRAPETTVWQDFPSASLWLPRLTLIEEGPVVRGVAAIPVFAASDTAAEGERLRMELAAILAAASAPRSAESRLAHDGPVCLDDVPGEAQWGSTVANAVTRIRAGQMRKVVLARSSTFAAKSTFAVGPALAELRDENPFATVFAVGRGQSTFLGATPELLVRLADRRFETVALAGTVGRGPTPEADLRLARQLLASPKDREEHEIVVETILDALRPISHDVRRAEGTPRVERSKSVQHLSTPISGTVDGGRTVLDLVGRLHPTPAVGGAPSDAALAFIRAEEGLDRGWYAGPVGWVGADGGGEFAVALRSGVVTGNRATIFAGCGIVADSTPDGEYAETAIKFRPMLDALGIGL